MRAFSTISSLALAASLLTAVPAFAGGDSGAKGSSRPAEAAAALPVLDRFEDEGVSLEVRSDALPYTNGASLTLVYRDDEANVRRTTVTPAAVATQRATFEEFLSAIDPAFLSFVRASVGDRMIRLQKGATDLDRAEASLFFPPKPALAPAASPRPAVPYADADDTDGRVEIIPTTLD